MNLWLSDNPDGQIIGVTDAGQSVSFETIDSLSADETVNVIMPGQWARIFPLDLPKLRGAERMQAAGFALEDRLAAPVDSQHIVIAADGQRAGVISKSKMQALIDALRGIGIDIGGIYLDYDVAPPGPAFKTRGRVIVPHSLTAGSDGYAVDESFYDDADSLPEADSSGLIANTSGALNFASGAYSLRKGAGLSPARLARVAGFAAILGLSLIGWQIMQSRAANAQTQYLKAQAAAAYTDATGQAAPKNPAPTVLRALKSGGGQTADFMGLSARLFSALEATPGAQIETLDYDSARAQIRVRVIYPDLQTATKMERAAQAAGATLTTGNLRERGGLMMGDAVLSAGSGS